MKFTHKILLSPLLTALAFALLFGITLRASNRSSETISRIQTEFFHALELSQELDAEEPVGDQNREQDHRPHVGKGDDAAGE